MRASLAARPSQAQAAQRQPAPEFLSSRKWAQLGQKRQRHACLQNVWTGCAVCSVPSPCASALQAEPPRLLATLGCVVSTSRGCAVSARHTSHRSPRLATTFAPRSPPPQRALPRCLAHTPASNLRCAHCSCALTTSMLCRLATRAWDFSIALLTRTRAQTPERETAGHGAGACQATHTWVRVRDEGEPCICSFAATRQRRKTSVAI